MTLINITSITQFASLATRNPALLNFSAFNSLRDALSRYAALPGCKCNGKKDLAQYRPQFEAAMAMLPTDDQVKFKAILNATTVCYFANAGGGKIKKVCF